MFNYVERGSISQRLYRVPQFRWESQQGVIVLGKTNKNVHVRI